MRRTAWYRLPEHIQFCFLIAGMLAVLIAIVPNYEALSYSKTEAVNDTNNYLGYPPGDEVAVLSTAEEIEQETHVFTMEEFEHHQSTEYEDPFPPVCPGRRDSPDRLCYC